MNIILNSASASATVVPSTIIVFLPDVTEQHQEDVRNSFEFAARAATKQASGIDYARWHRFFGVVLHNIHWFTVQVELVSLKFVHRLSFLVHLYFRSERAIRRPVLDVIHVSDSERHLASEALRALQNPENEEALLLFCDQHPDSKAAKEDVRRLFFGGGGEYIRSAKFQLTFCSEANGDVIASSFFIQLRSSRAEEVTIDFHQHGLNTRLFERVRFPLKKKLEDSGESKQILVEY
ncbi:32 kDa-cell wall symbiosis regulated acidic polypeptide precursor [Pisolithus orientalis]|uniref:32 kDa-cell wall symbiosis regulated acidic polypeptide precursor n=1 Tax=Pisolithus orientalis TaxID=936130 RepID=UPI0022257BA4|nr:32 kDa-cell wall symbiosis regulated acidic polypeptide precursor [Pisolithus orientalis]KAI6000417.1 32 kDa-cell wall symbiosis regulated acidic polypeptide precursor [Pisolithus orientalis]